MYSCQNVNINGSEHVSRDFLIYLQNPDWKGRKDIFDAFFVRMLDNWKGLS